MIRRCDLVPQYLNYKEEIDNAINRVLHSGKYTLGENVTSFEIEFAEYIGCKYGISVNSGTDALILSLWSLGIKEGDEVITTPFTAIPTYAAIRQVGATPIFVDINHSTYLMDLDKVKDAITEKTRAIIPVHLFGNVIDIEKLRKIIGLNIYIIEDCAQAHGARINDKRVGSLGDIAAFSFYPTKNLGGYGDGGMITTNNSDLEDKIRKRRIYGMINKDEFVFDGVNTRLDELQAAILRVKLRYLEIMNTQRIEKVEIYNKNLPIEFIRPQEVDANVHSVYHVYCPCCIKNRDELVKHLADEKIETNIYYPIPLHLQLGYKMKFPRIPSLPNSESVSKAIIALPFYPEIQTENIIDIALKIRSFFLYE